MITNHGRRLVAVTLAATLALVGLLIATPPATAAVAAGHDRIVSAVPAAFTPAVDDGEVDAIVQIGNTVVVGGTFSSVTPKGGTAQPRNYLFAFDVSTGALSTTFVPTLNGAVNDLIPGPSAGTVYVGGAFNQVNGANASHVTLLDVSTGAVVGGFKAAATNGIVNSILYRSGRLFVGGFFSTAGGVAHSGLASLNGATGALDSYLSTQLVGHHNDTGSGAQGPIGVRDMDINADGTRLVAIGNFKQADGLARDQLVMLSLGTSAATVTADWSTNRYQPYCFSWAFDSYVRGVSFSPDGSYFVVAATGGQNAGSLCDAAARFETNASGSDIQPTWVDYTGGDTLWAVTVTEKAVYVGGHQRWLNNSLASDSAGAGAVARPGIAALDVNTGVPLSWNPGRNPRGAAVYVLYATPQGLWFGSDTDYIGPDHNYKRPKLAFFPLSGGAPEAPDTTATLPGTAYLGGARSGRKATSYDDTLRTAALSTGGASAASSTDAGGITWSNVRGAFLAGGNLYYGYSDGKFYSRTFDGTTFGPAAVLDPYHNPLWDSVDTGSGNTYRGAYSNFFSDITGITSIAYANGRIFYTRSGSSNLYWRWFNVDSGIVGADRFTAASSAVFSRFNGMFIVGSTLYYADSGDGRLYQLPMTGVVPGTSPTLVDATNDWRARALFLSSPAPNIPPTAAFTASCTGLTCSFDAGTATDSDGSIASYAWDFGDGATDTGRTASHTYASAGQVQATLTVTDDDGATATATRTVSPTEPAAAGISYVGSASTAASVVNPSVAIPDGVATGDRLLLTASLNSDTPAQAPTGWTLVDTKASGTLRSYVWTKAADSTDAGAVGVTLGTATKSALVLTAYRGVDPDAPVAAFASSADTSTASHTTPTATAPDNSWAVSYWAEKSTSTSAWTPPAGVATRSAVYSSGTSRVSALLADSAAPVSGTVGGLTATTDATSSRGLAWTIVLAADDATPPVPVTGIAFVGQTSLAANSASPTVTVPADARAGDLLVLTATINNTPAVTAPTGWTVLDSRTTGLTSYVWTRTAAAGDAGSAVSVGLDVSGKSTLALVAYRGVDATAPVVAHVSAVDSSTASHTTPATSAATGDWVLSYWADKSADTSSWTAPSGVNARATVISSGTARVSSLVADSEVPDNQIAGGLTATTDVTSTRGISWTIVLAAAK